MTGAAATDTTHRGCVHSLSMTMIAALAVLVLGSASSWAQTTPPFPLVKPAPPSDEIAIASAIPDHDLLIAEPAQAASAVPIPATKPAVPAAVLFVALSSDDVDRYRGIFAAQQLADWATADRLIVLAIQN